MKTKQIFSNVLICILGIGTTNCSKSSHGDHSSSDHRSIYENAKDNLSITPPSSCSLPKLKIPGAVLFAQVTKDCKVQIGPVKSIDFKMSRTASANLSFCEELRLKRHFMQKLKLKLAAETDESQKHYLQKTLAEYSNDFMSLAIWSGSYYRFEFTLDYEESERLVREMNPGNYEIVYGTVPRVNIVSLIQEEEHWISPLYLGMAVQLNKSRDPNEFEYEYSTPLRLAEACPLENRTAKLELQIP